MQAPARYLPPYTKSPIVIDTALPLQGLTVLLTRSKDKARPLEAAIEQLGGKVLHLPTLEIVPVEPSPQQINLIENLDQYQAVVFVSSHAAQYGLDLLSDRWLQWPVGVDWVCVGETTAETAEQFMINAVYPDMSEDSTGMLALEALAEERIREKKVLIVRGQGGLEHLSDGLLARGAQVDFLEVYQRRCPEFQAVSQELQEIKQSDCDLICVYSGESVENLESLFSAAEIQFRTTALLAISERVAQIASKLGFQEAKAVAKGQVSDSSQPLSAVSLSAPIDQHFLNGIRSWYAARP